MKYFYCLIIILIFNTGLTYGQDLQTRMQFDYKGTKFYKDFQSIRNIGFAGKLSMIYPLSDKFSLEVKPGLFYTMGDYDYSGFEFGLYTRYRFYHFMDAVIGIDSEFSRIRIGDESMYEEKEDKLSDVRNNFAEVYAGFRLGSEKLGLNVGYLYPLIEKIAIHTYLPDMIVTDVYIKGTVQVGLDIKLYTFENIF